MMKVVYRGMGTGLRLEGFHGDVLDCHGGGPGGKGTLMSLYVSTHAGGASIRLDAADVALLAEYCAQYLAREVGVR